MQSNKYLKRKFSEQRIDAKRRGIPFLLTFQEWLQIWLDSGHLNERGRIRGQYCMARFEDLGAYEKGNVEIILHSQNSSDARKRNPPTSKTKAKISASMLGNQHALNPSQKTRKRLAKAKSNWWQELTPKELEEYKAKMSRSIKLMHARRKRAA